ncbi:CPBP family intramembrane metalloprotease [Ruania suaedae]|uniref:type II CAAX endopeptidase family protein n=1 Tax=Ruania suaedae TaxID=2897774 RepID=UPI001E36093B|nr:type II CAAX endopeptidase family protein [Ruania suaedae]UFU02901.1 CPBP family intramembrane metalloprotease [Ruania suaedae]
MPVETTAPPAGPRQRPVLLLTTWSVLLVASAAIAPWAQSALGVPYDVVSLVMFAPALACAIVLIRPAWLGSWWPRATARRVLGAASIAGLAVLAFAGCLMLVSGRTPTWPPSDLVVPVGVFLGLQTIGVLCEEVGWRGLVQRAGERFARPSVVSAVAGFLFGSTHLGYWSLGPLPVLVFAVTATLMSLTITSIFIGSLWQRMIPAVIVHLGVNFSVLGLAQQDEPLATTSAALAAAAVMLALVVGLKGAFRQLSPHRTHA